MGLGSTEVTMLLGQVSVIALFGCFVTYGEAIHPKSTSDNYKALVGGFETHYPLLQDLHVMVFLGFGFIMVYLK